MQKSHVFLSTNVQSCGTLKVDATSSLGTMVELLSSRLQLVLFTVHTITNMESQSQPKQPNISVLLQTSMWYLT